MCKPREIGVSGGMSVGTMGALFLIPVEVVDIILFLSVIHYTHRKVYSN